MRGATDVGLAARYFELGSGFGGDPDVATLVQVEHAGDSLERIRVLPVDQLAAVVVEVQCRGFAVPVPLAAEIVDRIRGGAVARELHASAMREDRIAARATGQTTAP